MTAFLWVGKIPWRRKWQPTPVFLPGKSHGQRSLVGCSPRGHKELDTTERLTLTYFLWGAALPYLGFPGGASGVKNLPASEGDLRDLGSIPVLGRSPGEGNGNPLQYFCLENLMDREAWRSAVCGVTKSRTSLKTLAPWKKSYDKPRQCIKKQRYYFTNKDPYNHSYDFSSSHVWMWELNHSEGWALKNWCFWTVVLEKTLESPLDCKEIQPVHPKGNQPWIFIGRTNVEAATPILWPPDAMSWLIGKDSDAGRDWGQEEKGTTDDEMAGWHHRLNGHGFG